MAARRKYPIELGDVATRQCAYRRIGEQLGVHPEALRTWVHRAEKDKGLRLGPTNSEEARIKELEQEIRELRGGELGPRRR
jgi:transposase